MSETVEDFFDYNWREALCASQQTGVFIVPGEDKAIKVDYVGEEDILKVLYSREGWRDSEPWQAIFELKNGYFLFVDAWCDYTGWGCRSGGHASISSDLKRLLELGVTKEEQRRLGIPS